MLCHPISTGSHLITHRECLVYPGAVGVLLPELFCNTCPDVCMQSHVTLLAEPCARVSTIMQRRACAGNAEGFSITPFAAGHLLGGCAWRITTPGDEDIVYAVHYNHRKQARAMLGCSFGNHAGCVTNG